ncbi:hypothetical protein SEA_ZITCH_61 [Gordonia Phage Zitch]|uniref:Uncharacterized protein n=1 Tax=Gordonia Phage Zitch TaxID=2743909 RepID=A0A7G3VC53_9CAUD|nr:hypothetical protein J1774_gp61 [Gordonia Phage Zitch]QKY78506.1 hypothetical protein SEA_ZITCH_61 [Gordonia Phage Zitch]
MTHHDTPRTPRTDAEHFIDRARTTDHLVDVPGIGAVATAAAILDLADAIRETGQPTVDYAEATVAPDVDECDDCETTGQNCRAHQRTAPRLCDRRWSEMSGAHHECVLLADHDTDRHQCECGAGAYVDEDEDSPRYRGVCPANGCGRPDGHDGDHLAAGPLTLPTMTAKRGGLRYHGQTVETQGSTLDATPFTAVHVDTAPDGVDDSPVVCGHAWPNYIDGDHEHVCAQPDDDEHVWHVCDTCLKITPDVCGAPGLNGTCRREAGHSGLHHDEHGGAYLTEQDTATMTMDDVQSAVLADEVVGSVSPATEPVSSPVQPPNGDADPLWRLRLLAGRARRAAGRAPLPVSRFTLGALVDDLDDNVRQLIESRDKWADAAERPAR